MARFLIFFALPVGGLIYLAAISPTALAIVSAWLAAIWAMLCFLGLREERR